MMHHTKFEIPQRISTEHVYRIALANKWSLSKKKLLTGIAVRIRYTIMYSCTYISSLQAHVDTDY